MTATATAATPPKSPAVAVVIVNYRTPGLTIDCLRSLAAEAPSLPGGAAVLVTDNASGDDSADRIAAAIGKNGWADWASLMPLPRNGGFAYGNNAAIRQALHRSQPPRYVLLLNPDTIVRPGAVGELVTFLDTHPRAGIAGSRLEYPDGSPQVSAFRFPSVLSEFDAGLRVGIVTRLLSNFIVAPPPPAGICRTDWVSGASFMVRREVLDSVGLLDEGYFMYYEELDLCLRARRAGWECWHVPASRVVHLVGQSSGINTPDKPLRRMPAYWFESRRRYFVKNHGWPYAAAADAARIATFAAWRLARAVLRRPDPDPPHLLGDFVRHSVLTQRPVRSRDKGPSISAASSKPA
jgi:N-acetylglucosaminyl-diphospho-decaprenol L-rhamnosyltransferase